MTDKQIVALELIVKQLRQLVDELEAVISKPDVTPKLEPAPNPGPPKKPPVKPPPE